MSKLDELIQQYCPDGVEWKTLGEATIMKRGTSATKGIMQEGDIPVISGGRQPAFFCNVSNRTGEVITVAGSGAGAGYVQYWNEPIFVCDAFSIQGNETLKTKYVYYILTNIQEKIYSTKKGGGVPHVHISSIDKLEIPVPPLPVQEEIVRILDNFTELQAELQAELQKRKQQYNYYLDNLLSFKNINRGGQTEVKWMQMSEVMSISRGASPRPIQNYLTDADDGIPWIKIGDVSPSSKYISSTKEKIKKEGATKSRYLKKGDFILSNSMSFGRPYILNIDGCIHDGWISMYGFEEHLDQDYLYYVLRSESVQTFWTAKANSGGAVSNLNSDIIRKTLIPIPSMAEQKRIASILDRFDTLTNDLTQGLPAEIEKRRQQYEYYRDKLLTFKRKAA